MRVLILTADYPPQTWSGIGHAVARQARALTAQGVDVHVLHSAAGEAPPSTLPRTGPVVHRLDRRRCPVDPSRFDLVHLHSLSLSALALEMARRFGLPLVYTAHSLLHLEVDQTPRTSRWCAVQQLLLAASQHVIFLSRAEQQAARALMPELVGRSSVVPNGVEPLAAPARYEAAGPIVFAGRFARTKGVDLLAEALPPVVARWQCPIVLAGGHGDEVGAQAIRRLQSRVPAALCQVRSWLSAPHVQQLLARARLVLSPSLYEPFGQTALEAMRVGAPVLAAAVGGLAELITAQSGGVLIDSHEPTVWRRRMDELLASPTALQELHQRGPRYVAEHFDIHAIVRRIHEEIYACV